MAESTNTGGGDAAPLSDPHGPKMRADKWLWHARFFKTRGIATKLISAGHLRVNSAKVSKPSHSIGAGDVLTFPQGKQVRVVRILTLSTRRGPAPEAQTLYDDLDPPAPREKSVLSDPAPAPKTGRKGRPTKKDRRNMLLSRRGVLD